MRSDWIWWQTTRICTRKHTVQPASSRVYLCQHNFSTTTGTKIMNNWTFWHIEHGFGMGLAPANPWPSCHRRPLQGREVWCLATQLSSESQTSAAPSQNRKAHRSHRIPQELHDFMLFRSCGEVKTCPRYCCTIPKITWLHAIPAICSGYVQDSN